ncbi:enoyl-CoA hydratase [Paraburkholderia panacisoli]|uniref:Enoyl-CoA hydratase n=1 Tax=Paraburkholderia panacisoli TaxID=2603818 RepID=A0A5B0G5Z4_9BURK|nr:enoyl-CoA hydratase-related protein [Paraburkholderia panacisoli]KAA0998786.1 enoyl-CoA hydratase [Paraburkholderia panacisoli]
MHNEYFHISNESGIAHLQLSRPDRLNTMGLAFFTGLRDAVLALDDAGDTRALVISSTGKHFSAGMALDVFTGTTDGFDNSSPRARLSFQHALRNLMNCFDTLDQVRFPVICAIQGGCMGGGLDLAVACDIRTCTTDAFFALQETQIGMTADLGVLQRLPKIIPAGVARQMAYTSERLSAERALAVGLVNALLPDAEALLRHAMELARTIASKSPLAVAGCKAAINFARDHSTSESLRHMALLQSAVFDTQDIAEAISAWHGKRQGRFDALSPLTTRPTANPHDREPLQASRASADAQPSRSEDQGDEQGAR